ncbi:putative DAHP synthetase I/KDSA, 3-deoxy-8-phosphooctulonate synthase, aldolase-type TIM barrel [Plasmopara halstedii]
MFSHRRALAKTLRQASPFFLIAGPCVLESQQIVMTIAKRLAAIQKKLQIPVIFKASFDKANRQDLTSFRGPGLECGLAMLQQVKDATGLPVLTDVHETHQVASVAKVVDVIQIPAFLSRQTDLLLAAATSGKLVNLKKGQMLSAETMLLAAKKIAITQKDSDFMLTERGSMFGYGDLVVDPRNLPLLRRSNGLVVQDVTHSVQRSSSAHTDSITSGGNREFIPTIARMAAAVGVDGFFFETHLDPTQALCDAATMIPIDELEPLLEELVEISNASKALHGEL